MLQYEKETRKQCISSSMPYQRVVVFVIAYSNRKQKGSYYEKSVPMVSDYLF